MEWERREFMFVMYHKEERKKETSGKRDMYDIRAKRGYRERERGR
jgi:hypothetical protein